MFCFVFFDIYLFLLILFLLPYSPLPFLYKNKKTILDKLPFKSVTQDFLILVVELIYENSSTVKIPLFFWFSVYVHY